MLGWATQGWHCWLDHGCGGQRVIRRCGLGWAKHCWQCRLGHSCGGQVVEDAEWAWLSLAGSAGLNTVTEARVQLDDLRFRVYNIYR